jgi:hypothetical protein
MYDYNYHAGRGFSNKISKFVANEHKRIEAGH